MTEGHSEWFHSVNLGKNMQLKCAVLSAANRNDAVIVGSRAGLITLQDLAKLTLAGRPVDVNFLSRGLTCAANPHLVELHALVRFGHTTPNAVLNLGKQGV